MICDKFSVKHFDNLNFGHINCRGINVASKSCKRLDIICGLLICDNISVTSVCETFLKGNEVQQSSAYT